MDGSGRTLPQSMSMHNTIPRSHLLARPRHPRPRRALRRLSADPTAHGSLALYRRIYPYRYSYRYVTKESSRNGPVSGGSPPPAVQKGRHRQAALRGRAGGAAMFKNTFQSGQRPDRWRTARRVRPAAEASACRAPVACAARPASVLCAQGPDSAAAGASARFDAPNPHPLRRRHLQGSCQSCTPSAPSRCRSGTSTS